MSEESINLSSESSSGSHNQTILMFRKDIDEFSPHTSPSHRFSRTGTVRRTGGRLSLPDKNMEDLNQCVPECFRSPEKVSGSAKRERYRRSLDATYRRSLDSISEYKPKRSFSSCLVPSSSRECSSIDSSSSDYTDYTQHRSSTTDSTKDTTLISTASSNYASWLENVSQDIMESTFGTMESLDGEWNSFWSQYTNPLNKHLSCFTTCNEEKMAEDYFSDCKSNGSANRETLNKEKLDEKIIFTREEITEAMQCSQRLTEILQTVLKRNEDVNEIPGSPGEEILNINSDFDKSKVCPFSFDPKRRQQIIKKPIYSSNSYLNALLSSGVADILKKMLSKRRSFTSDEPSLTRSRSSCSE